MGNFLSTFIIMARGGGSAFFSTVILWTVTGHITAATGTEIDPVDYGAGRSSDETLAWREVSASFTLVVVPLP